MGIKSVVMSKVQCLELLSTKVLSHPKNKDDWHIAEFESIKVYAESEEPVSVTTGGKLRGRPW